MNLWTSLFWIASIGFSLYGLLVLWRSSTTISTPTPTSIIIEPTERPVSDSSFVIALYNLQRNTQPTGDLDTIVETLCSTINQFEVDILLLQGQKLSEYQLPETIAHKTKLPYIAKVDENPITSYLNLSGGAIVSRLPILTHRVEYLKGPADKYGARNNYIQESLIKLGQKQIAVINARIDVFHTDAIIPHPHLLQLQQRITPDSQATVIGTNLVDSLNQAKDLKQTANSIFGNLDQLKLINDENYHSSIYNMLYSLQYRPSTISKKQNNGPGILAARFQARS